VLVVEDSPTARSLLVEILRGDPAIDVVGESADGADAVRQAVRLAPDVITMDIHMPVLDGIDATKAIMREAPTPIVIVSAAAVPGDVELSLNATQAGALMLVEKPSGPGRPDFAEQAARLVGMVKAMSQVKVVRRWRAGDPAPLPPVLAPWHRRTVPARFVAIGTSTGGPAALRRILIDIPRDFPLPILVVQHIAAGFVAGLANWLGANCALRVTVAAEGQLLEGGTVYLAPDGRHLGMSRDGRVRLSDVPPIGGFRPSADHLFESCGVEVGGAVIALILTGMGRDGVEGLRAVRKSGGTILAQDEASSIVYGMNGEAVMAGLVDEVLSLELIAKRVLELAP